MAALLAHVWRSLPASTLMPRRPCLRRDQGWGPTSVPAMEGLASMGTVGPKISWWRSARPFVCRWGVYSSLAPVKSSRMKSCSLRCLER